MFVGWIEINFIPLKSSSKYKLTSGKISKSHPLQKVYSLERKNSMFFSPTDNSKSNEFRQHV
jgi:hypothetical protein